MYGMSIVALARAAVLAVVSFKDWLAKDYVPVEGAQRMLNYIGCHRYFVRDESELEFLRPHFARVQAAEGSKR